MGKNWERVTHKDDKRLKMYMLYDRVMRNIQNRHKRINQMNSFINARFQRKLIKFAENTLSGSPVSGLGSRIPPLNWVAGLESRVPSLRSRSRVPGLSYELGPGSRVSGSTNSLGSWVPLFGNASFEQVFYVFKILEISKGKHTKNITMKAHSMKALYPNLLKSFLEIQKNTHKCKERVCDKVHLQ